MAYIRGQETFVQEEVVERLRLGLLEGLHYDGSTLPTGQLPWGMSVPLTFVEAPPDPLLSGAKTDVIAPNTVALSEGFMPVDEELEMGGQLIQSVHTFFIDVYGEDRGIAKRIALDVRALMTGRVQGYPRVFQLRNWADPAKPVIAGSLLRIEDVELDYPGVGAPMKMHWAVVKLTVHHENTSGY